MVDLRGHVQGAVEHVPQLAHLPVNAGEFSRQMQSVLQLAAGGATRPCDEDNGGRHASWWRKNNGDIYVS